MPSYESSSMFALLLFSVMMMMMMTTTTMMTSSSSVSNPEGFSSRIDYGDIEEEERATNRCITKGGHCYTSEDCCHGYICSVSLIASHKEEEDFHGGHCMMQSCRTSAECGTGNQCIDSDITGQGQCQTSTSLESDDMQRKKQWSQHMYNGKKGGLGTVCEHTSECKDFTMDGQDKLCCQDVRRGRQGTKRMCDRVTGISVCIN